MPYDDYQKVAFAYFNWSPKEFWEATLYEYLLAFLVFKETHGKPTGLNDEDKERLKKMMEQAKHGGG